jgi:tRNA threonylcarbamoyladenosine biosynthesis protein TsaB
MRTLALDTTTRAGSLALLDGDRLVDERIGDALRPHAERLPAEIIALLSAHGLTVADVDLFAIAAGPGSFTGLRIGIATIQGLAFVHRRPVVAVSALEALAQIGSGHSSAGDVVGAWIDAHRGDVFSALYRVAAAPMYENARLVEIEGPAVDDPAATIHRWSALTTTSAFVLIGDRLPRDAARFTMVAASPLAGVIGRMAVCRAQRGETVTAAGIQPLYVRRPDAEVARDRAKTLLRGGE